MPTCPGCNQTVSYDRLAPHVQSCVNGRGGTAESLERLEHRLQTLERRLSRRLEHVEETMDGRPARRERIEPPAVAESRERPAQTDGPLVQLDPPD